MNDQPTAGQYRVSAHQGITIFGGYPVREILDPQGNLVCSVAFFQTAQEHAQGIVPDVDTLLAHLNRTAP